MQFTRWQVQNLVGEVQAQNGHTADDLDGLVPAPGGMPWLSQLAAWLTRHHSALAQWAHEQYTKADFSKPDTLTYPTVRAINPSANSGTLDMLKRVLTQVENR